MINKIFCTPKTIIKIIFFLHHIDVIRNISKNESKNNFIIAKVKERKTNILINPMRFLGKFPCLTLLNFASNYAISLFLNIFASK